MKKQKKYILAIDAGGTKTDLILADRDENIIAQVKIGQSNLHNSSLIQLKREWRQGFRRLLKQAKLSTINLCGVGVGIAGLDSPLDRRKATQVVKQAFGKKLPSAKNVYIVNDTVIGFWSGSRSNFGIGIVGGTGSNCYGRTARGKEAWASGMGHILADQGSGYEIGLKALKAVVKSEDGRGPKTMLTKMVLDHFKVSKVRDLIGKVYYKDFAKHDVAQMALLVQDAAEAGDKVARQIAYDAAEELTLMIKAVGAKLGFKKSREFDLVMIGGVIQKDPFVNSRFKREVKKLYPKARFIIPKVKPVIGAVRMVVRCL